MKKKLFGFFRTRREGLALISVLAVVTLATIMILALFSVSDAEFKSAKNYADGAMARQLADNTVNLVISQIQAGATGGGLGLGNGGTIWASQPGGIRVYRNNGEFVQGRRLYSSDTLVFDGSGAGSERTFARQAPAAGWTAQTAAWVDLNAPVVRASTTGGSGAAKVAYFPILDPRAAQTTSGMPPIEGFKYSATDYPGAGGSVDGVVTTGDGVDLRVPMPVQWLYVLKDGSMGTLTGDANGEGAWSATTGGGTPTKENPIVGRVAFWTDDESCRVNINTAGEPGFYATPTVFHGRDWNWANNQPVLYEFQRFPGHPATVALSSVLYPNPLHETGKYDADSYPGFPPSYIELKDKLSLLAPKIGPGGSADGTRSFAPDEFNKNATSGQDALFAAMTESRNEHPFASVDELIFANKQSSSDSRDMVNMTVTGVSGSLVSPELLERARFFLSAHSRAPETNMYGYPRVAIWPVPDDSLGSKFRTVYDSAVAYAGSLGSPANAYYFRRRDANSALVDIGRDSTIQNSGLVRNGEIMSYLAAMITSPSRKMPGGGNFQDKYGADAPQILVEIFDYIRCTNLFDSILDEQYLTEKKGRDFWDDNSPTEAGAKFISLPGNQSRLWTERPAEFSYYTYTAPRFDTMRRVGDLNVTIQAEFQKDFKNERVSTGMYPGHGQVRPIEWSYQGQVYRGLGRFPTISEVALHFICTGDGKSDPGSFQFRDDNGNPVGNKSGGKTAKKLDASFVDQRRPTKRTVNYPPLQVDDYWYSNIPPYPDRATFENLWSCSFGDNTNAFNSWTKHPGYNARNWNCTLEVKRGENGKYGVPLKEDEKRVQLALEVELFVPAVGYTKYAPDFSLVLDGRQLANLQVKTSDGDWTSVFDTTADQVVQSTVYYTGSGLGENPGLGNVVPVGGTYGAQPLMQNRVAKGIGEMPADPGYNDKASSDPHGQMVNFPLVSNYFTVKRNEDISFRVNGEKPMKIDIYAAHDRTGKNATPTQTVYVKLPSGTTPVPKLVVHSSERRNTALDDGTVFSRAAVHAPRWWAFNAGGAVNRYEGTPRLQGGQVDWRSVQKHTWLSSEPFDTRGRFTGLSNTSTSTIAKGSPTYSGNLKNTGSGAVPMSGIIFGYSALGGYNGVRARPEDIQNEDTVANEEGNMDVYSFWGSDSIRSVVPTHGDYRILAGRREVPETVWERHRVWTERPNDLFAHSLSSTGGPENGFDTGASLSQNPTAQWATNRLVQGTWYPPSQVPDAPQTQAASDISTRAGDFDTGPGNIKDGAYINKADDGNLSVGQRWYGDSKKFAVTRNAYFIDTYLQFPASGAYFTPNRMISSPVVFGSLPTGVFGSRGRSAVERRDGAPWRTLLFRPDFNGHMGSALVSPADHNILDMFWMPVVQPYAISDSFATAGKINLNFQMLGFPHIHRSTALHAAMKGELITAFSPLDARPPGAASVGNTVVYKQAKQAGSLAANSPIDMWGSGDPMEWHRKINIAATLKQLEDRFFFVGGSITPGGTQGLLRTASQLCEIHLVPRASTDAGRDGAEGVLGGLNGERSTTSSSIASKMSSFWQYNRLTGDNIRERPYANLYQKVTTRSNTYRVYFTTQTIRKAKSVSPTKFDPSKDSVTAEYRGSALIDRYLDFTSVEAGRSTLPNYAAAADPFGLDPLEKFYRFRILEMKQFSP